MKFKYNFSTNLKDWKLSIDMNMSGLEKALKNLNGSLDLFDLLDLGSYAEDDYAKKTKEKDFEDYKKRATKDLEQIKAKADSLIEVINKSLKIKFEEMWNEKK